MTVPKMVRFDNMQLMNRHVGSSFDDFLQEEGTLEECEAVASKRVFVYQLEKELEKQHITKSELAIRMATSRAAVSRLLDPNRPSTLRTLSEAARALGKHLRFELV